MNTKSNTRHITMKNNHKLKINDEYKDLISPLSNQEYDELKNNIILDGEVINPIIVCNGVIIDGHNRYKVAIENNLPFKIKEMDFANEEDKKIWIIRNQIGRRNLNHFQKIEIVNSLRSILEKKAKQNQIMNGKLNGRGKNSLKIDKSIDVNNEIAKMSGCSRATVAKVNHILKSSNSIIKDKLRKGDIKISKAFNVIKRDDDKKRKMKSDIIAINDFNNDSQPIQIHHGNCLLVCNDKIKDGSIDAIITDPPYGIEYLECWEYLADIAQRVLKPSGFLVTYAGALHLNSFMKILEEKLEYYYLLCLVHDSFYKARIKPRKISVCYKPILIFHKPPIKAQNVYMDDVIRGGGIEKDTHKWQQPVIEAEYLIKHFTNPNDLILDPFAGGGTTLIASNNLNRRCIGIEIDKDNVNRIHDRLSQKYKSKDAA